MKVNAYEKPIKCHNFGHMKNWREKPWKVTNFKSKNPEFISENNQITENNQIAKSSKQQKW
jgi:hypothetical protein